MATTMIVQGAAPGAEMHETTIDLGGVPRAGDQICVWTGDTEEYAKVSLVTWMAFPDYEGDWMPRIWIDRPEHMDDDEWAALFVAIKDRRKP